MNKKYLDPKVLSEYVEALCEKNNHPDTLKQALLNQINVLRQTYGNEIPKDDFCKEKDTKTKKIFQN